VQQIAIAFQTLIKMHAICPALPYSDDDVPLANTSGHHMQCNCMQIQASC
jgi:hypothetical protein